MKTDNYLSLCLEQAAKSPLHYRHGAIVVRGGKVIGHGYNDYKPGFNGGSLKHGKIAKGTFDAKAVKQLKDKLKEKDQQQQQDIQQPQRHQQSRGSFVPFEGQNGTGGGHSVNQPLSMHSEMMAIYSALSASSTLSSTTFAREKPCFKLPRGDKRKTRLRRDVLMAYVAAVCQTSTTSGKSQVKSELNHNNNNKESECYNDNHTEDEGEDKDVEAARMSLNKSLVFHAEQSRQKHHHHRNRSQLEKEKKKGKRREKRYGYQHQYQHGSQIRQEQPQRQAQPSASKLKRSIVGRSKRDVIRGYDAMTANHDDDDDETATNKIPEHGAMKPKRGSGQMRSETPVDDSPAEDQPLLLPSGHAGAHSVADRRKHHRLKGADLYVTRLGWDGKPASKPKRKPPSATPTPASTDDSLADSVSFLSSISATSSRSATGSLHDELVNRDPSPSRHISAASTNESGFDRSTIHASRPCYRCITFMHSVGIRRVFWTNDAGEWQGGKVADLVDSMDGAMESVADGGPMGNGVFVTKHEVLMLRRMMGANCSAAQK